MSSHYGKLGLKNITYIANTQIGVPPQSGNVLDDYKNLRLHFYRIREA